MTGICTDIGNILGQGCRTDTKAELWRLKIHVPLLLGFLLGGIFGQLGWLVLREYSLLVPCFFTGGVACLYLTLPFIRDAADKIKQLPIPYQHFHLGAPTSNAPVVDAAAAQALVDHYSKVVGRNVDDEIMRFLTEIENNRVSDMHAPDEIPLKSVNRASSPTDRSQYGAFNSDESTKILI